MLNISRAMKSDRIMKSLTGLSTKKFETLLPYFELILQEEEAKRIKNNKKRQRKAGGGRKHTLDDTKFKLFYILFYLKIYPTFDLAGFIFDVNRSQTHRWTHHLLPLLEKALGRKLVLPKRQVKDMLSLIELFPETKDLFIDGTERKIQRSKDPKTQQNTYSGKKKTHTIKNLVVNNGKRKILMITPTLKGSMHDKKIYDKYGLGDTIPKEITQWLDTGFKGVEKRYDITVEMPKKKPRGKPLSYEDRENNKTISAIRITSEHAIGGIKRLGCVKDTYRNRIGNLEDKFIVVSAGIWNLEIENVA